MEAYEIDSWFSNGYIQKFLQAFRTIVPGKVIDFDSDDNTASVLVAIQDINQQGQPITTEIMAYGVPCLMVGGSQNSATFELAAGDYGVLLVCDRDIDNFKAKQGVAPVASQGVANLKDCIFLSGLFQPSADGFTITSQKKITLNCQGAQIIMQEGNILLNGNVIINNAITIGTDGTVTGDLTVEGTISASEDVETGSISLKNHYHNAPGGNTGPPIG